jgi:hypothetical protein
MNNVASRRLPHDTALPQRTDLRLRQPRLTQHRIGVLFQRERICGTRRQSSLTTKIEHDDATNYANKT